MEIWLDIEQIARDGQLSKSWRAWNNLSKEFKFSCTMSMFCKSSKIHGYYANKESLQKTKSTIEDILTHSQNYFKKLNPAIQSKKCLNTNTHQS